MINLIEQIEGLVSNKIATFKTILSIFKLEARLARLSIYPLIINVCVLFVVILTIWFSVMCVIGYFAMLFLGTVLLALLAIITLNIILLGGLLKYLNYNLNNMSFEKTRAYLSPKESCEDDKLKKTITQRNSKTGKNIANSTKPGNRA